MPPNTISIAKETGKMIRARRRELGYTVEEAAYVAGVSPKTWGRYEAGGSVRSDKLGYVLRVLRWRDLPGQGGRASPSTSRVDRSSPFWLAWARDGFSEDEALALFYSAKSLCDELWEARDALSSMPRCSHIGQVPPYVHGRLADCLPRRYLTRYGYEFLFEMKNRFDMLVLAKLADVPELTHTCFFDDVIWFVLVRRAQLHAEVHDLEADLEARDFFDDDRVYEELEMLFEDAVIPDSGDAWHFDNWSRPYERRVDSREGRRLSPLAAIGLSRWLDTPLELSWYLNEKGELVGGRGKEEQV